MAMPARLVAAAREAATRAYAPYSHFSVGAALLGEKGEERLKAAVEEIVSRLKGKEVFAEQEEQSAEKEGESEGGKEGESAGGEDARGE